METSGWSWLWAIMQKFSKEIMLNSDWRKDFKMMFAPVFDARGERLIGLPSCVISLSVVPEGTITEGTVHSTDQHCSQRTIVGMQNRSVFPVQVLEALSESGAACRGYCRWLGPHRPLRVRLVNPGHSENSEYTGACESTLKTRGSCTGPAPA